MTREEIDAAYEIDSKVPDVAEKQARYTQASAALPQSRNSHIDLRYGPDARHTLDLFVPDGAAEPAPAILFFHGGYWKGGSKNARRFPAPAWNGRGIAWASVEYRLAPDATLDAIIDDVRSAVSWFHKNAARYGCDPHAIHIAGNSAGGHITAMIMADGWQAAYGVPPDVAKSGTPVSGLFDFDPLLLGYTEEWLALDADAARRNSPVYTPPRAGVPMIVPWGSLESNAFATQSRNYVAACNEAGAHVIAIPMEGHDHYSIIGEFAEPASPIFKAIEKAIEQGERFVATPCGFNRAATLNRHTAREKRMNARTQSTTGAKTGKQFLDSLGDGREVWFKGRRIANVAEFEPFAGVARTLADIYDLQHAPETRDAMTFETPDGWRASKSYLLPTSRDLLIERRRNHEIWAAESFGMMGRNPDFCGGILCGLWHLREQLGALDPAFKTNVENYLGLCQRQDLCLTHGLHDPNMDKTKRPKEDPDRCLRIVARTEEGYIVRGARYATLAPFANEILVYPSFMLQPDEDEFAIWFALPMNAPGVKTICRDSYSAHRSEEDFPLSVRFDEQDALVVFDDVLVPHDRVFLAGNAKEAVRLYRSGLMRWAGYASAVHVMARYELFIGVAHLLAETAGTSHRPRVQEEMGELITWADTHKQLFHAAENAATVLPSGLWASGGAMTARNFAILISERMVSLLEHLGTGAMIFNTSAEDFAAAEIRPYLELYGRGRNAGARDRQRLVRLAFELTGEAFGSRQQLYERLHSGDPYVWAGNAWRNYDKSEGIAAVNRLLGTDFQG